jgi:hypothetical protein
MSLIRKQVGAAQAYKGSKLTAHYMGPDLLSFVDGVEMPSFYLNVEAARRAGRVYVDAKLKVAAEAKKKDEAQA